MKIINKLNLVVIWLQPREYAAENYIHWILFSMADHKHWAFISNPENCLEISWKASEKLYINKGSWVNYKIIISTFFWKNMIFSHLLEVDYKMNLYCIYYLIVNFEQDI